MVEVEIVPLPWPPSPLREARAALCLLLHHLAISGKVPLEEIILACPRPPKVARSNVVPIPQRAAPLVLHRGRSGGIPDIKNASTYTTIHTAVSARNPQPPAVNFRFDMFSSTVRSLRLRHTRLPVANTVATLAGAAGAAAFFHNSSFRATAKMADAETKDAFSPKVRARAERDTYRAFSHGLLRDDCSLACPLPSRDFPPIFLDTARRVSGAMSCIGKGQADAGSRNDFWP